MKDEERKKSNKMFRIGMVMALSVIIMLSFINWSILVGILTGIGIVGLLLIIYSIVFDYRILTRNDDEVGG